MIKKTTRISVLTALTILFFSSRSFAANRYWVGSILGNWNNTLNWSNSSGGPTGFSVPTASDAVIFDAGNLFNCTIDANVNVAGVSISSLYLGTISVNPGLTITLGASGFSQAGGTFTASNGNLTINGGYTLSGGTFTSTSATLQIAGGYLFSGGTFNHNYGTLAFSGTQTISGNTTCYKLLLNANGGVYTIISGTIITAINDVSINGGNYCRVETGTVEILGNLTLINTSTSAFNGGTATFLIDGTGTQTINSFAASVNYICSLPNVVINKTSGTLNLIGIINFNGSSWNTIAGAALINAGTAVINILQTCTLSGQNLSFYDIVVTGNFSFITIASGVTWTSTHLITLAGGSSWYQINTGTLNAKGDVLVTNTNTSFNVGGNAILLFDGNANQILTGSGIAFGGRLPKVQIDKTGGTLTLANPIISMDNSWNYIAGNVDATSSASTVDFYRTATINGQGASNTMEFNNVIISGQISLGGNLKANGDLTIRAGVSNTLDVTAVNNYQVNVGGNWTNNNSAAANSFNQQNGKVVFDGGNAQQLTLATNTDIETFYQMEIKKTSNTLALNAPVTISNNINFVTGNINTTTSNILLLNNTATAIGGSNSSFVVGPVRKTGNQAFIFPVGKNGTYAPIAISAPVANTHQFTAEYFNIDPNTYYNSSNKDISIDHISGCEYWNLDRTVGTSNVTVNLSWDLRSCGVADLSDLRVVGWNGISWKDQGNGATTGNITAGTITSIIAIATYGPFTLASSIGSNPLPITLLSFNGTCTSKTNLISWSTASEMNNNYFLLERSNDALNWSSITKIFGNGNSSTLRYYKYEDRELNRDKYYYRLKQVDYDGYFNTSTIITVKSCITPMSDFDLEISPNPSSGIFNLKLVDADRAQLPSLEIYNLLGKRIFYSEFYLNYVDLSNEMPGVYFIKLIDNEKSITKKIVLSLY